MPYIAKHLSSFTRKEISTILRHGKRILKGPDLDILMIKALQNFGRILVITPRKVGNAPERNRIRRRLKAFFYQHQLYNEMIDCCVFVKKAAMEHSYQELTNILEAALQKYKALR